MRCSFDLVINVTRTCRKCNILAQLLLAATVAAVALPAELSIDVRGE